MQAVHFSIVLFYYAIFSVITLWIILLGESFYNDEPLRVLTMSLTQVGVLTFTSCFNTSGLLFHTIALQNEKSSFIMLISYTSIIYAFLGDIFIFHSNFSVQELLGVSLIAVVILTIVGQTIMGLRKVDK
jgi:drug/metabolite transporter (DMT)-like permease